MPMYKVTYEIVVEAADENDAAEEAREYMQMERFEPTGIEKIEE